MSSNRRKTRRTALERNLKKLRSSGRVRTVTPPPEGTTPKELSPFQAMVPDPDTASELDALRDEVQNLRRLHEVIHFLNSAPDLESVRGEVLDLGLRVSDLPRGMLALRISSDDGRSRFKIKVKRGFGEKAWRSREAKLLKKILNRALETGETLLEGDIREDGILGHAAGGASALKLGAVACLPLTADGDVIGALIMDDPDRQDPFGPAEQSLLRSFARHAALALARLSQAKRLKRRMATVARRNERLEAERDAALEKAKRARRRGDAPAKVSSRRAAPSDAVKVLVDKPYAVAKEAFTEDYLARVLRRAKGDLREAAKLSGLPVARLIGLLNHLEIDPRSENSGRWGKASRL